LAGTAPCRPEIHNDNPTTKGGEFACLSAECFECRIGSALS
jgi:hypothetical protein